MLKTTIEIDGKPVVFKASAAIPRIYRIKFHRDIYKDLRLLEKSVGENDEDDSHLDLFSLGAFREYRIHYGETRRPVNTRFSRGVARRVFHILYLSDPSAAYRAVGSEYRDRD